MPGRVEAVALVGGDSGRLPYRDHGVEGLAARRRRDGDRDQSVVAKATALAVRCGALVRSRLSKAGARRRDGDTAER
jgi:hypothetical protein